MIGNYIKKDSKIYNENKFDKIYDYNNIILRNLEHYIFI